MKKLVVFFLFFTFFCKSQKLPTDWKKHYVAGSIITSFSSTSIYYLTKKQALSSLLGVSLGFLSGIVKEEFFDRSLKRGVPSNDDKIATALGSCFATIHFNISVLEYKIKETAPDFSKELYQF